MQKMMEQHWNLICNSTQHKRKAVDLASGDLDINYVKALKEATPGNSQYVIIDPEHLR